MIVAYVSPKDTEKRTQVMEAAGDEPVTFRDPDTFTAADADPLDRVVYAAGDAEAIRKVYEGLPNATVHSLDDSPLQVPDRSFAQRRQQQKAQRVGQPIDAAAVPNVHPPDLLNPALDPGVPIVADNHLEGMKRVDAAPVVRERSGRFTARAAMQADAPIVTEDEEAKGVTVEPADAGLFRPNASAGLQHTEPEPMPVATLQKPVTEPPQTRPRSAPGTRREGAGQAVPRGEMPVDTEAPTASTATQASEASSTTQASTARPPVPSDVTAKPPMQGTPKP